MTTTCRKCGGEQTPFSCCACEQQAALEADPDFSICDRCGGDGMIEYNDGDGSDWGEDCPSEINHLITCRACQGTGKHR